MIVCSGPMQRGARRFDWDGQLRGVVPSGTDDLDSLRGTKRGGWSFKMVPVDHSAEVTDAFMVTTGGLA